MPLQYSDTNVLFLSLLIRMALFAIALMWPAGTWTWWEAWVEIVLFTGFSVAMTLYLYKHDVSLLKERTKLLPIQKEQKLWDKVLMALFVLVGLALYIVPGFDVHRYQWSEAFATWVEISAMLLQIPCLGLIAWVMHENSYSSQVVKIDKARGHKVVTTGPYSIVRHPMYSAVILLSFAVPVALGSRYGLIPALFLAILLLVRTCFEDCALQNELDGYRDYVKKTSYRIIPGVW